MLPTIGPQLAFLLDGHAYRGNVVVVVGGSHHHRASELLEECENGFGGKEVLVAHDPFVQRPPVPLRQAVDTRGTTLRLGTTVSPVTDPETMTDQVDAVSRSHLGAHRPRGRADRAPGRRAERPPRVGELERQRQPAAIVPTSSRARVLRGRLEPYLSTR